MTLRPALAADESAPAASGGDGFLAHVADLFDDAPIGVVATDQYGVIVYVNRRQCELSRLPADAFLGQHRRTLFFSSQERNGIASYCDALERDGTPIEFSMPNYRRHVDDALMAVNIRGYRYRGLNLFLTTIDETLARHADRYEQLFENANDGIFILSRDGRFVAANEEFARIVGLPREEIIGKTTEIFLPGRFQQSLDRLERTIREGRLGPYELAIDTPSGKKVTSLNGFALTEGGKPVGVMNIARDVTERKLAEQALERESLFVRLLKNVAVASNEASTTDNALRRAVEEICALTGWPVGHVYSRDAATKTLVPTAIWHCKDAERYRAFCESTEKTSFAPTRGLPAQVLATGKPVWIVDVTHDGNFTRVESARAAGLKSAFAFPVLVGAEITAVLEFFSDAELLPDEAFLEVVGNIGRQLGRVVERERLLRDLAAARDEALESAKLKSSFLASMSHEIRTPLNGVIGMAGLLIDGKLGTEEREYAETIRSCADTLLAIINDILDFSKIEAGKLAIEPIAFDCEAAAQEVLEILAPKAVEKGLNLVLRYAPETPSRLVGDPGRVRQVLTNLVNNALKFTERGQVFVNVECERAERGTAWIRVTVEDSGIGIPRDKQGQIFERFTQADASTTRKYGGTGLGLAISKQLVELMGGSIGFESRPGEGSTFWFVIPLPLDPRGQEPPATAPDLAGLRVLSIDDNAVNRRVLRELVTRWDMQSSEASSAADALSALRAAHVHGEPFDIAIVDLNMPDMDGEALGRAIKADADLRDTVLLLLTSSGQRGDGRQMAGAGFAAYMTKPVRPAVLLEAIANTWSAREGRGAAEAQRITRRSAEPKTAPRGEAREGGFSGLRVLVVEDNVVNQKVASLILERFGCRVDVAGNGEEAVEMVERMPYDVVFMDCQMPVMDGYDATREIRRRETPGRRLPIVAMTAHAMQGDRETCLASGMDDYVSKPIQRRVVEAALQRWARKSVASIAAPAADPQPA